MGAFDELYVRFFRSAVECAFSASAARERTGDEVMQADAEYWQAEANTWGKAALALRPYMSQMRVRSLEGSVMRGRFTLNEYGIVQVRDAATTK